MTKEIDSVKLNKWQFNLQNMKTKYFQTFNEFRRFNNSWRESQKKEHQHKYIVAFYYPFALIGLCLLYGAFFWFIASTRSRSRYSYRTSDKYRKVIKEGIFWDTVEYQEK
jgi:putative salt-induced outer membrane protein YdiY